MIHKHQLLDGYWYLQKQEEVILVYEKGNRVISIALVPRNTFADFSKGDVGRTIDISLKN